MSQLLFVVRAFFRLLSRNGESGPAGHRPESHTHWDAAARNWRAH
jgi:hypothetical protein